MLWIGIIIGLFVGANVGIFVLAMCTSAKRGDDQVKSACEGVRSSLQARG